MVKLLVANRGEIACRIFETCRVMGIKTVAVYSEGDKKSLHVQMADEAYPLKGITASETYLNRGALLEKASQAKATALHPGYGFLSENPLFASEVIKKKIIWIGPPPESIRKMGSKIESKILAQKLTIRTLPWKYVENDQSVTDARWKKMADEIGYPLLIKAASGGGGRGMRLVHEKNDFLGHLESARREAHNSFGEASVFLEKFVSEGRHIEVQILADTKGRIVHLFDRECSVQRRHQKIIEEAPAPRLKQETRKELIKAALKLAEAIEYEGVGTVEFLVDEKEKWFFLEMNTRLQVEHPVTEWITGLDLVTCQIKSALGEKLGFTQDKIGARGHAMECRIYAENPYEGFIPTPGPVEKLRWPTTRNCRIDTGLTEGNEVSAHFDAMVAKLSTWGLSREEARLTMREALKSTTLLGFTHNIPFLQELIDSKELIESRFTTSLIEKKGAHFWNPKIVPEKTVSTGIESAKIEKPHNLFGSIRLDQSFHNTSSRLPLRAQKEMATPPFDGLIRSPFAGRVSRILISRGEKVKTDTLLMIVEAMKMEYDVISPVKGEIEEIKVSLGDQITPGQLLILMKS